MFRCVVRLYHSLMCNCVDHELKQFNKAWCVQDTNINTAADSQCNFAKKGKMEGAEGKRD